MSDLSTIDGLRLDTESPYSQDVLGGSVPLASPRPQTAGKFLRAGDRKLWVKGVTYGTFRGEDEAGGYPSREVIDADFSAMRAAGINTVRVYTVPPRTLLDIAQRHGLYVMVGLPWEQHIAFLDEPGRADSIVERVRSAVRSCRGHPAVLCYAVGNEIPAPIVRWHGRRRIERFIHRLYDAAKREDPDALVTYVNYPTTEYLQLPFLDIVCFNVYLESEHTLSAYLARLQNLAGERPLVLAELGLDSRRNGEEAQAASLAWQLRATFAAGCAGAFVSAGPTNGFAAATISTIGISGSPHAIAVRSRRLRQSRLHMSKCPFLPIRSGPAPLSWSAVTTARARYGTRSTA
jgi:O-antigen biosynthesis protein